MRGPPAAMRAKESSGRATESTPPTSDGTSSPRPAIARQFSGNATSKTMRRGPSSRSTERMGRRRKKPSCATNASGGRRHSGEGGNPLATYPSTVHACCWPKVLIPDEHKITAKRQAMTQSIGARPVRMAPPGKRCLPFPYIPFATDWQETTSPHGVCRGGLPNPPLPAVDSRGWRHFPRHVIELFIGPGHEKSGTLNAKLNLVGEG